jgi:DNA (cytosine-5)-methyltransferase 1
MNKHKFAYKWNLSDGYPAPGIEKHGLKVFGTFICGGGSTMGYKLAGFNHLGGVEIDPQVADVYKANHNPKYLFTEDIRGFADRATFPDELYNLDILDGSPPCSSFSMAGNREKDWGKEKVFREGQAKQRLDDLFFDYIRLAKKLQPKVIIAENVKGMLQGNAKAYVKRIKDEFEKAGYKVQLFLLNAASMGVPQKRERVFFICQRNDLKFKPLKLVFDEKPINYGQLRLNGINDMTFTEYDLEMWQKRIDGDRDYGYILKRIKGKESNWNSKFIYDNEVCQTITSTSGSKLISANESKHLSKDELKMCGSYPLDYNFKKIEPKYLIGMSVPPVMTAQVAHQIYLQWLKTDE